MFDAIVFTILILITVVVCFMLVIRLLVLLESYSKDLKKTNKELICFTTEIRALLNDHQKIEDRNKILIDSMSKKTIEIESSIVEITGLLSQVEEEVRSVEEEMKYIKDKVSIRNENNIPESFDKKLLKPLINEDWDFVD